MDGDFEFELKPQRRDYPRWEVDLPATVSLAGRWIACRLTDISATGASAELSPAPAIGTVCVVDIPDLGRIDAEIARLDGKGVGFHFRVDEHQREELVIRLADADFT